MSETAPAKRKYTAHGLTTGTSTELAHLVPLELGGDNAIANLWPELGPSSGNPEDAVENDLNAAVCDGRVKLADAQRVIAADGITAERDLGIG